MRPSKPPLALISSMAINSARYSGVSRDCMDPDNACRRPIFTSAAALHMSHSPRASVFQHKARWLVCPCVSENYAVPLACLEHAGCRILPN